MIERAYVAFREALDMMALNTTCTACRLLPTLDLKQFVHYGSFMRQEVAGHTRLVGHGVNLIHRLLKNSIGEAPGYEAYAAYTQSAVDALRLGDVVSGLKTHREAYADVGEVRLYVIDVHQVWEEKREPVRLRVRPEGSILELEAESPVEPEALWNSITYLHYLNILHQGEGQHIEPLPDGEVGPGGVNVCAHGREVSRQLILDWQPPEASTIQLAVPVPSTTARIPYLLEPIQAGTRLRLLFGEPQAPRLFRLLARFMGRFRLTQLFRSGLNALQEVIEAENEPGDEPPAPG